MQKNNLFLKVINMMIMLSMCLTAIGSPMISVSASNVDSTNQSVSEFIKPTQKNLYDYPRFDFATSPMPVVGNNSFFDSPYSLITWGTCDGLKVKFPTSKYTMARSPLTTSGPISFNNTGWGPSLTTFGNPRFDEDLPEANRYNGIQLELGWKPADSCATTLTNSWYLESWYSTGNFYRGAIIDRSKENGHVESTSGTPGLVMLDVQYSDPGPYQRGEITSTNPLYPLGQIDINNIVSAPIRTVEYCMNGDYFKTSPTDNTPARLHPVKDNTTISEPHLILDQPYYFFPTTESTYNLPITDVTYGSYHDVSGAPFQNQSNLPSNQMVCQTMSYHLPENSVDSEGQRVVYKFEFVGYPQADYTTTYGTADVSFYFKNIDGREFPNPFSSPTKKPLPMKGVRSLACPSGHCFADYELAMDMEGDPVNAKTGAFSEQFTDLSFPTISGNLSFTRSYTSQAILDSVLIPGADTAMGYGWTHNHTKNLKIDTTNHIVSLNDGTGNELQFAINNDGTYTPDAGVTSDLSYDSGALHYILKDAGNTVFTFNNSGKLISQINENGYGFSYTYDGSNRLSRVTDTHNTNHYLQYSYNDSSQLSQVSAVGTDGTSTLTQSVSFGYDANNDLTTFTDASGKVWTYSYSSHFMNNISVYDNLKSVSVNVTKNIYDSSHRVVCQQSGNQVNPIVNTNCTDTNSNPTRAMKFVYNSDNTVITGYDGQATTQYFDENNLPSNRVFPSGVSLSKTFTDNYQLNTIDDPNGNSATVSWGDKQNVSSITDASGRTVKLSYVAGSNKVSQITETASGTTVQADSYTYDAIGKLLISKTDAAGLSTTYDYTAEGLVSNVHNPNGQVSSSTYNGDGQILTSSDGSVGDSHHSTYDLLGRLVSMTDFNGNLSLVCRNTIGQIIKQVTNAQSGNACSDSYTPSTAPDKDLIIKTYYDGLGLPIAIIAPDGKMSRTYYDENNLPYLTIANLVLPSGQTFPNETPPDYDTAHPDQNIHARTFYDAGGRVIATQDNLNRINRTYYDVDGYPVQSITNLVVPSGQAQFPKETPPNFDPSNPDQNISIKIVYDANHNTIATIDTYGHATRSYYDAMNRVVAVVKNLHLTSDLTNDINNSDFPSTNVQTTTENIITRYYYDVMGNQIAVKAPTGVITRSYFDNANRITSSVVNIQIPIDKNIYGVTLPSRNSTSSPQNLRTDFVYDATGINIASIDTIGRASKKYIDTINHKVTSVDNIQSGYDLNSMTPPTFDSANPDRNLTTVSTSDVNGNIISQKDTKGLEVTTTYDLLNHPIGVTNANNKSVTTDYDKMGETISVSDPMNHKFTYGYDALGRKTSTTDPLQNSNSVQYDGAGRVTYSTDFKGIVTKYNYNQINQLTSIVNNYKQGEPSSADTNVTTSYTYDGYANLKTVVDGRNHTISLSYDILNRLISRTDQNNYTTTFGYDLMGLRWMLDANHQGTPSAKTHYTYDVLGRLTQVTYPDSNTGNVSFTYDNASRKTSMTDGIGTTTYAYDGADRVTSVIDPYNKTVAYTYDPTGLRTGIAYPDSTKSIAYAYDNGGRLTGETASWITGTTSFAYDDANRLISKTLPNGITSNLTFDNANRLTEMKYSKNSTTFADFNLGYDSNGNRTSKTETYNYPAQASNHWVKITVLDSSSNPLSGVVVMATDGSTLGTTDTSGVVNLWLNNVSVQVLVNGNTYVSSPINSDVTVTMPDPTHTNASLVDATGQPVVNIQLNLFAGNLDLGQSATTDSTGKATFNVENSDNYLFTATAESASYVYVPVTVTVTDSNNNPVANTDVMATINGNFNSFESQTPTGIHGTTNTSGNATLSLPKNFAFKFRVKPNGIQPLYTSTACDPASCASTTFTLPTIGQVAVTVTDGTNAKANVPVYAFSNNAFTGVSATTNASGVANFSLDGTQTYDFRTFDVGTMATSATCTFPACTASTLTIRPLTAVSVIVAGGNATTKVFTFSGSTYDTKTYTGLSALPDANGKYSFNLPAGSYWFGVLKDGVYTIEDQNQTMTVPQSTTHAITASSTATFAYDNLSRLTNATYNDGRNFTYGYDATGNRVQQVAGNGFVAPVTTNYTFDPANRLTSDGTKNYTWDANGNMTGDGSRTFTFDSANRLRQLVIGANTYTYGYDGNGNRLSSAVNGGTAVQYQLDNASGLSQVLSDGTNLYIPGLVQSNADGTNAQYFLQDALGSNVMLADATANWTVLPQYDPFGQSAPTSLTKFGYTGEQKDASGLEFLRARYYDQNLGIFTSKDPESGSVGNPAGGNGYNYASDNPIMASDPTGRDVYCPGQDASNCSTLNPLDLAMQAGSDFSGFDMGLHAYYGSKGSSAQAIADYGMLNKMAAPLLRANYALSNIQQAAFGNGNLQTAILDALVVASENFTQGGMALGTDGLDTSSCGLSSEIVNEFANFTDADWASLGQQEEISLVNRLAEKTRGHTTNTAYYASQFPELYSNRIFTDERSIAYLLHDAGKDDIPYYILDQKEYDASYLGPHGANGANKLINMGAPADSLRVMGNIEHHGITTSEETTILAFWDQMEAITSVTRAYKDPNTIRQALIMVGRNKAGAITNQSVVDIADGFIGGKYDINKLDEVILKRLNEDAITYKPFLDICGVN